MNKLNALTLFKQMIFFPLFYSMNRNENEAQNVIFYSYQEERKLLVTITKFHSENKSIFY